MMTTFRIATVNIHQFRPPNDYKKNITSLVSVLKPLQLDLLAVEEINNDDYWRRLCESLDLNNFITGKCDEWFLSNGIASRYPILSYSNHVYKASGEARAFLQCQLAGNHSFVQNRSFAVTHLDHMNEDTRLAQINYFQPNIDILMGDMNALTKDDYSEEYYQKEVVLVREKSQWEKPRFDLTDLITRQWGYQDAFRLANSELKDESVATCAYGTRIDYIYLRPRENDPWKLTKCSIVDSEKATDHNIVFAEFTREQS
ncbi:unnamed protein product [Adineta ricciae]|uniref:Endonuclease/exonuclease/phosphatase domain-containing protein n=1 Tax=Adineta ricciae TaxID=249248 RepID=A0A816G6G3_ADIRI|nr:unnamed protein product [Adineta ricciae]